jgi:protein-L-isoaspartate(D-aspartate) O-methyltransferase
MNDEEAHFAQLRRLMVQQQIAARGVKDIRVLEAMATVPRHRFVPPEFVPEAYDDYPLPIGKGQTISQPYIVAAMTERLELKGDERVLEIGTGSGYQAAVLSALARDVFTIEIVETLARAATERFAELHYSNIHVKSGDGYDGWTEAAPFDAIIVTAAAPYVPDSLKAQLVDCGRLVIPVGEEAGDQVLMRFHRQGRELRADTLEPVRFVPMRGEIERRPGTVPARPVDGPTGSRGPR